MGRSTADTDFSINFVLKNNGSNFNGMIIYAEVASFLEKSL